eukprot:bmy_02297T0
MQKAFKALEDVFEMLRTSTLAVKQFQRSRITTLFQKRGSENPKITWNPQEEFQEIVPNMNPKKLAGIQKYMED